MAPMEKKLPELLPVFAAPRYQVKFMPTGLTKTIIRSASPRKTHILR